MKESNIEGLASHDGPESCAGVHKGVGEALTGVRAGWDIEPRNHIERGCRRRPYRRKATRTDASTRASGRPRAVEDPMHVRTLHAREPGGPLVIRLDGEAGRRPYAGLTALSPA
jgi:hypothetical protein